MTLLFAKACAIAAGAFLISLGFPFAGGVIASAAIGDVLLDRLSNRVALRRRRGQNDAAPEAVPVVDLHADLCLWRRDLTKRHRRGHADLPRLREGGVALQVVAVPTKLVLTKRAPTFFPADLFFWGALYSQQRPKDWLSPRARAETQLRRLETWIGKAEDQLARIANKEDLAELGTSGRIGLLSALEGAHALPREDPVGWLERSGFRILGLTHFNDNRYAGSAHGPPGRRTQPGLSDAGRELVKALDARGVIIDLAHASEATIDDALAMRRAGELARPFIVSHTGLRGLRDHRRNLADRQAIEIARGGGLIGISFFEPTVAEPTLAGIAAAVNHAVQLLDGAGVDGAAQVALGSDFDGAVRTVTDAAGWPDIAGALLDSGLSEAQTGAILGGNARRFFALHLPSR